jgi:two-component system response regulator PilR (NtrC family)
VRAIGSTQEDAVDVRIVSATHRDLAADVQAGRFRQDLFYRLNVIEILVPPLRERRDDLPALCQALLARIAQEPACRRRRCRPTSSSSCNRTRCPATCASWRTCCTARWRCPTARCCRSTPSPRVRRRCAQPRRRGADGRQPACAPAAAQDLQGYLDQQEREILVRALQETGFNRTAAAQRLGLSLRQIRYRIARLAIATPGGDESR